MKQNDEAAWIEEYVACYDVVDSSELAIERAHLIKEANLPSTVYKFRAVNEYSLKNLADDTVWLSSPAKYNDPYDCAATISAHEIAMASFGSEAPDTLFAPLLSVLSEEEIAAARQADDPFETIVRAVLSRDQKVPSEYIPGMIDALRGAVAHVLQPHLQRSVDTGREAIRMCSFSERNDIILMWSHYAENHSGFCIEYQVRSLHHFVRRMLQPVIYKRERFDATKFHKGLKPNIEGFNNLYGVLQALYKAPEWSYEQEWRFVLGHGILEQDQSYGFGTPSRVYLGAQIDESRKEKVLEICKARGFAVSQMRLSATEYRMVAEPLD